MVILTQLVSRMKGLAERERDLQRESRELAEEAKTEGWLMARSLDY